MKTKVIKQAMLAVCVIFLSNLTSLAVVPVAMFEASDTLICEGDSINFTDQSTQTPTSWAWTFGGGIFAPGQNMVKNPINVQYTTAGQYTVSLVATNGTGSSPPETKTDYIRVIGAPSLDLGVDTSICAGQPFTIDATKPLATYSWSTGASTPSIVASTAGKYFVTVTRCGSSVTDTLDLTETPFNLDLGADTQELCFGNSFMLDAGNPQATFLWNNGDMTATTTVDTVGLYFVFMTDTGACFGSDSVMVTDKGVLGSGETPQLEDVCIFSGNSTTLDPGIIGLTRYIWSTGESTETISVNSAGLYTLRIVDEGAGNCFYIFDSATVYLNSLTPIGWPTDSCIDPGPPITLNAGNPGNSFNWSTGDNTQTILASAGEYSVIVTDLNGCTVEDTINVSFCSGISELDQQTLMVYPNIVSDKATIQLLKAVDSKDLVFAIYDLTGKAVKRVTLNSSKTVFSRDGLATGSYLYNLIRDGKAIDQNSMGRLFVK